MIRANGEDAGNCSTAAIIAILSGRNRAAIPAKTITQQVTGVEAAIPGFVEQRPDDKVNDFGLRKDRTGNAIG